MESVLVLPLYWSYQTIILLELHGYIFPVRPRRHFPANKHHRPLVLRLFRSLFHDFPWVSRHSLCSLSSPLCPCTALLLTPVKTNPFFLLEALWHLCLWAPCLNFFSPLPILHSPFQISLLLTIIQINIAIHHHKLPSLN